MSQAMLMRIINLEKRVDELEREPAAIISAPYQLERNGPGWFRVHGPEGEITERGLRKHEAQALADDLNAQ